MNAQTNKLYGKKAIFNGDSITAGSKIWGAWADRIAERNSMTYKNYGVGGGTLTENVLFSSGTPRHSISATLELMHEEYPDADYIILEGGTNDADLLGFITDENTPERLGSFDLLDFSGDYDKDTFCGALESIFFRATKLWKGKKIGFIIAQKMGTEMPEFCNRRAYFDIAVILCEKWGIPYLDLWNGCYLNPNLPHMYDKEKSVDENIEAGSLYKDGQHLTSAGYDFVSDIIDSWMKTL